MHKGACVCVCVCARMTGEVRGERGKSKLDADDRTKV